MNGWQEMLLDRLWNASLLGGAALTVAWVITSVFRRLPAPIANWLWRLALLKVVLSLLWVSPIEVTLAHQLIREPHVGTDFTQVITRSTPNESSSVETPPKVQLREPFAPAVLPPPPPLSKAQLLASAWLVGVALFLVTSAVVALRRRGVVPLSADLQLPPWRIEGTAADLGLSCPLPAVRVVDTAVSPVLFGLLRPTILLPAPLLEPGNEKLLYTVLAHEFAHVKRRDLAWTAMLNLCTTVLFFHPLIWLARRPFLASQEMACDATVLSRTHLAPNEYEDGLLTLLRWSFPPAAAGLAVVPSQRENLDRRLRQIEQFRKPSRRRIIGWSLALSCLALVGLTPWKPVRNLDPAPGTNSGWPMPIEPIDWSVPHLISPAQQDGYELISVTRVKDSDIPELSVGRQVLRSSQSSAPYAILVWFRSPAAPSNDPYSPQAHPVAFITANGFREQIRVYYAGPLNKGSAYLAEIPTAYPTSWKSLQLSVADAGWNGATWTFDHLPASPVLLDLHRPMVTEAQAGPLRLKAEAWATEYKPRTSMEPYGSELEFLVNNENAPPNDHKWSVASSSPILDHTGGDFGESASEREAFNPPIAHPGFSGLIYPIARQANRAEIHAEAIEYVTFEEQLSLNNVQFVYRRDRERSEYDFAVKGQTTFTSPSGIPIRITANQAPINLKMDAKAIATMDQSMWGSNQMISPDLAPRSPLVALYHKPIKLMFCLPGFTVSQGALWRDGALELNLVALESASFARHDFTLRIQERVNLNEYPVDFFVPVQHGQPPKR